MGYGFATQIVDWDGDGRLQPVIYDRRYLWVFDPRSAFNGRPRPA
jgi:hypothetical protein